MTLAVVLLLPAFIRLGFWQLDRAGQKEALLHDLETRLSAAPVAYDPAQTYETFSSVIVSGQFDGRHFLLDNQVLDGRVGFDVISVFELNSGELVLVNRGFVEGDASRSELPKINTPKHPMTLTGMVSRVLGEPVVLSESASNAQSWPVLIQAFQAEEIQRHLPTLSGRDWQLRIDASQAAALEPHYEPVRVSPEKHYAYAVQWFAMAITLTAAYILFGLGMMAGSPLAKQTEAAVA